MAGLWPFKIPAQGIAEHQPGAVDPTLDGGDGQAEGHRDLAVGQPLDVGQHERVAVRLGEPGDRRLDQSPPLPVQGDRVWRGDGAAAAARVGRPPEAILESWDLWARRYSLSVSFGASGCRVRSYPDCKAAKRKRSTNRPVHGWEVEFPPRGETIL